MAAVGIQTIQAEPSGMGKIRPVTVAALWVKVTAAIAAADPFAVVLLLLPYNSRAAPVVLVSVLAAGAVIAVSVFAAAAVVPVSVFAAAPVIAVPVIEAAAPVVTVSVFAAAIPIVPVTAAVPTHTFFIHRFSISLSVKVEGGSGLWQSGRSHTVYVICRRMVKRLKKEMKGIPRI